MDCPFCAEEIKDDAIVCKHCRRDISVPKPVLDQNRNLAGQVAALEQEVAELRHLLAHRPTAPAAPASPPGVPEYAIGYVLAPLALLVAAHYLMIMKFDVNPIYLRVASMLIPLPFGYVAMRRSAPAWPILALLAAVTGFASVMAMSAVVGVIDGVPILPATPFEWRETIEYMLSITLAYVLGGLIAQRIRIGSAAPGKRRPAGRLATQLAAHVGGAKAGKPLEGKIEWIEKMLNSSLAISAAVGSIYTGLKAFLD